MRMAVLSLLLISLIAGCTQDSDTLKAQKLIDYNDKKYDNYSLTGSLVDGVRVINVKAYQFYFEPEIIVVNKGDRIKLVVDAVDVPHGFEIEGFNIPDYDIETVIRPGIPLELDFYALEAGEWDFICTIYCGFGHSNMKGKWVIKE